MPANETNVFQFVNVASQPSPVQAHFKCYVQRHHISAPHGGQKSTSSFRDTFTSRWKEIGPTIPAVLEEAMKGKAHFQSWM